jgi:hypothetical protein
MDARSADAVRAALLAASDPSGTVRRWKTLSGRKAVGCPPRFPVPEILHAAGMLPVIVRGDTERALLCPLLDEWAVIQEPFPHGLEGALDWVESVAEWAESVSGEPCREGDLERSMRYRRERDSLEERLVTWCGAPGGRLDAGTLRRVIDSGRFLPVEAHAYLLADILGVDAPAGTPGETCGYDPFLLLARRARAEMDKPAASGGDERRNDP